jgi:hypothetical protein
MENNLVTGDPKIDHWLSIIGAFVTLASALTSVINHRVRMKLDAGTEPTKALVAIGSALNFASVNIDKGLQLMRMFRGTSSSAPQAPVAAVPTEPTQPLAIDPTTAAPATCPTCGKAI